MLPIRGVSASFQLCHCVDVCEYRRFDDGLCIKYFNYKLKAIIRPYSFGINLKLSLNIGYKIFDKIRSFIFKFHEENLEKINVIINNSNKIFIS